MNADTAGAVSSLALPFDLPLAGLALVLAAVLGMRFAEIGRWRRYARLGNLGAGAMVGLVSALAVLPAWLARGIADPLTAAAVFEAALLPPLALLSLDLVMGVAAAVMVLVVVLGCSAGAAWPAAVFLPALLGIGVGLIQAKLEPFATWLDWRWARTDATAETEAFGLDAPLDAAGHWRAAAIGLGPGLLLLPLLGHATAAGMLLVLLAIVLHVPVLWAMRRLLLSDWPRAALPSGLIADTTQDRESITPLLARIIAELPALGYRPWASEANFVLFDGVDDPQATFRALLERDILIRDVGIPNALRVTAGTEAETTSFLDALARIER